MPSSFDISAGNAFTIGLKGYQIYPMATISQPGKCIEMNEFFQSKMVGNGKWKGWQGATLCRFNFMSGKF